MARGPIRNPGKRCFIRVNKEAFTKFLEERKFTFSKLSRELGYNDRFIATMLRLYNSFSITTIDKMAEYFSMRPQDMEFIDDQAHKLLYQLGIPFDGPMQKGNKIARIREYLAQGLDRLKIRELLMSSTLMHSAVSEAFDEVANSEEKTLGNVISECAMNKVSEYESSEISKLQSELSKAKFRIAHMEGFLSSRERTTAQALAHAIVQYLKPYSEDRPRNIDEDPDHMDNIRELHGKWSAIYELCELLHISVKKRPILETAHFFIVNSALSTGYTMNDVNNIKIPLYMDTDIFGRYPINTNADADDESCEKEEE